LRSRITPRDLAPGENRLVIGSMHRWNQPRLYQLKLGIDQNRLVTAEAVL